MAYAGPLSYYWLHVFRYAVRSRPLPPKDTLCMAPKELSSRRHATQLQQTTQAALDLMPPNNNVATPRRVARLTASRNLRITGAPRHATAPRRACNSAVCEHNYRDAPPPRRGQCTARTPHWTRDESSDPHTRWPTKGKGRNYYVQYCKRA